MQVSLRRNRSLSKQMITMPDQDHDNVTPKQAIDAILRAVHVLAMLIFKIFRRPEWNHLRDTGETAGAPIDLADGYVHFSTAAQVATTAALYFADQSDLVLVTVETDSLGDALKWDASRGGDLFPHLYRKMQMSDVVWDKALPLGASGHIFPESHMFPGAKA
jgi:uncharacterized protein (DUF952 family)